MSALIRYLYVICFSVLLVTGAKGELNPVAEPGVCLECHGEFDEIMKSKHAHTVFREGRCSGCHNPHATEHAGLLAENDRELCWGCHQDIKEAVDHSNPHVPAINGDCVECHDPHASPQPNQLVSPLLQLCIGCHGRVAQWLEKPIIHDPIEGGECLTCHGVHGSPNPGMTNEAVPGLCFSCHDVDAEFEAAHAGRPVQDSDCTACHDPHSSTTEGLLREYQHKPFASGNCKKCHDNLESEGSFAISGSNQDSCLGCHRATGSFREKTNHHNLDSEDSCLHCHNPHASNTDSLLKVTQVVLCMSCHFNDAEDKDAQLTHDGVDCTECHLPHGGDDPQLLKSREAELCADCHVEEHKVSHPLGPDVIDPRTSQAVNCLSCHQLHGARFEKYLPLSPEMDLCIQCHDK